MDLQYVVEEVAECLSRNSVLVPVLSLPRSIQVASVNVPFRWLAAPGASDGSVRVSTIVVTSAKTQGPVRWQETGPRSADVPGDPGCDFAAAGEGGLPGSGFVVQHLYRLVAPPGASLSSATGNFQPGTQAVPPRETSHKTAGSACFFGLAWLLTLLRARSAHYMYNRA